MNEHELTRLANELRSLPERTPEPMEIPTTWRQHDDGMWSPVYQDGHTGTPFTYAQMIAAKGEDIGILLESLIDAGLVIDVAPTGVEVFETESFDADGTSGPATRPTR